MKNPTDTLAWIITIGLWILAGILGSCALTACGGEAFVYDAPSLDAGPVETEADVAPDALDADPDHVVGLPPPKRDADTPEVDAELPEDATPEATADAGTETCASVETQAECIPSGAASGISYAIPDSYCVWLYDHALNPPATPVVMMMPAACRCDYTQGCLAGSGVNICPAGSTYYAGGIFETDAGASRIVCQQ
jgi:hypothetical protein